MKLIRGLNQDTQPVDQPSGSWRMAKNIVIDGPGTIVNEEGFVQNNLVTADMSVVGQIPVTEDRVVIFLVDTDTGVSTSEIGILEGATNNYIVLNTQSDFLNFNKDYPVSGDFIFNGEGDLIIVFTDDLNPPKIFNLQEANQEVFLDNANVGKLFPEALTPQVNLQETIDGGSLQGGVYYFSFAYELDDGSQTNWLSVSNPITVTDDSVRDSYANIDGMKPGDNAGKSIILNLKGVDTRYPRLKMAVIKKINGIVTAEDISDFVITSTEIQVTYSGDELTTDLLIEEIVADRSTFEQVKSVKILNDRLYLGNVYQEQILDYQRYANDIVVQWYGKGDVAMDDGVGSYKDPTTIYTKRSFMPGEVYALYIRFILKNGSSSPAFHIPGRPPRQRFNFGTQVWEDLQSAPDETADAAAEYIDINKRAKYFHFNETADNTLLDADANRIGGYCGYWENLDEVYASDEYAQGTSRNLLTEGKGDGRVKHHKMPGIGKLHDWGFKISELDESRSGSVTDVTQVVDFPTEFGQNGWPFNQLQSASFYTNETTVDLTESVITLSPSITGVWSRQQAPTGYPEGVQFPPDVKIRYITFIGPQTEWNNVITDALRGASGEWDAITPGNYLTGTDSQVRVLQKEEIDENNVTVGWDAAGDTFTNYVLPVGYGIHYAGIYLSRNQAPTIPGENPPYLNGSITLNIDAEAAVEGQSNASIYGNVLGLYVRNVQIPEHIRNIITGYEIVYAERSTSNSLSLGGSVMFDGLAPYTKYDYKVSGTGYEPYLRFFPPDMLLFKPNNRPTHFQVHLESSDDMPGEIEWDEDTIVDTSNDGFVDGNIPDPYVANWNLPNNVSGFTTTTPHLVRIIRDTQYLETDNSAGIVDNSFKEAALYSRMADVLRGGADLDLVDSDTTKVRLYVTLQTFKANLYNSIYEQALVSTGQIVSVPDGDGTFVQDLSSLPVIYGGDAFLQPYYQKISSPSKEVLENLGIPLNGMNVDAMGQIRYFGWPTWTAMNAGLIHEGTEWTEKYYPKTPRARGSLMPNGFVVPISPYVQNSKTHVEGSQEDWNPYNKAHYIMSLPQPRNYNSDYTSINNLEQSFVPYDPIETYLKESPNLVARSLKASRIDPLANIRRFLSEDVYEMPKNKGEIWHLDALGDMLLIHQKHALFRTVGKEVLRTGAAEVTIGSGDIFEREPKEVVPSSPGGFAGTTSKYAAFTTKLGYFFVDQSQGKVFLLNDTLRELSSEGLKIFFRDNMPLSSTEDNPYFGVGMTAAYDRKYNRIILSKVDTVNPWTVSFSADSDSWVSFHDYNPNVLFASDTLFSAQTDKVWKHNAGNRGIYYVQDPYPSSVDIIFVPNMGKGISAAFASFYWQADLVSSDGIYLRDNPISSVLVYNNYQASGYITLDNTNTTGNTRNVHNLWKFNSFRDIAVRGSVFMSEPFYELNENQLDTNREWWQRKRFMDQFGAIRLVYSNNKTLQDTQNTLYLYSVDSDTLPLAR